MNNGESIPVRAEAEAAEARPESDAPVSAPVPLAENPPAQTAASPKEGNHEEDKHEESTMIDVHAPHGGLHTWKDFWIHLGTIALGLLIALGLEQTAEWVHHLHQRHQLEEDLRTEGEYNHRHAENNIAIYDKIVPWLIELQRDVEQVHATGGKNGNRVPTPAGWSAGLSSLGCLPCAGGRSMDDSEGEFVTGTDTAQ